MSLVRTKIDFTVLYKYNFTSFVGLSINLRFILIFLCRLLMVAQNTVKIHQEIFREGIQIGKPRFHLRYSCKGCMVDYDGTAICCSCWFSRGY